ncbi:MAG: aspartyl-phosphate phosphatase Spo0E family protein [Bacillota bacterium]
MIFREALDLSKSISKYRSVMYELAKNKGLSNPDVIKISQQLDTEILKAQKILINFAPRKQDSQLSGLQMWLSFVNITYNNFTRMINIQL